MTMSTSSAIQLGLEDLLADLQYARKRQQLGRLALLAYCEVRSWARQAGRSDIADAATSMFTETPCVSKDEFLSKIDSMIATLECHKQSYQKLSAELSGPETFGTQMSWSSRQGHSSNVV
jgi:hypothetical protein